MASKKRELPKSDVPEEKKAKLDDVKPSEAPKSKESVVLNSADCDLDFDIEGNGLQGSGLYEGGFAYCWSGARANVGITRGKYCFGCKVISSQPVDMEDTPFDQQHVCRLGISRGDDSVGNLGETHHSFGFGGTGKFSNAGKFSDYGEKYGIGDTIVCAVNLENKPLTSISFSKNGKWLGTAKDFDAGPSGLGVLNTPARQLQWESSLFPHVLLKNVVVQLQFSIEDGLVPEEGYKPWVSAVEDGNVLMGPTFLNLQECEVIMMVGLPASGKTTWAEKWVKEHPEKRYVLLGTNLALDQMKVPGLLRKHNYGERFERLMDRATGIFNALLYRASKTPRNFIIDQTNVYKSARKRKLKPFASFRKIAVVVLPTPAELKFRSDKRYREMGKEVPAEAIDEMLANFVLPTSKDMPRGDEYFDQVMFPEQNRGESLRCLDEMKANLKRRSNLRPSSHESCVQSCYRPGQYPHDNPIRSYGDASMQYSGMGEHLEGFYSPQLPLRAPSTNYYTSGAFFPRDDQSYYGSYGGHMDPRRNEVESRIANPGGLTDCYYNTRVSPANIAGMNPLSKVSTGNRHWVMDEPLGRTSVTYDCYDGLNSAAVPRQALPASRPAAALYATTDIYGSPSRAPTLLPRFGNNYSTYRPGGYAPAHQPGGYAPAHQPGGHAEAHQPRGYAQMLQPGGYTPHPRHY